MLDLSTYGGWQTNVHCELRGLPHVVAVVSFAITGNMITSRCVRSLAATLVRRGPITKRLMGHAGFRTHNSSTCGYLVQHSMWLGAQKTTVPCNHQSHRKTSSCRPATSLAQPASVEVDIMQEGEPSAVAGWVVASPQMYDSRACTSFNRPDDHADLQLQVPGACLAGVPQGRCRTGCQRSTAAGARSRVCRCSRVR